MGVAAELSICMRVCVLLSVFYMKYLLRAGANIERICKKKKRNKKMAMKEIAKEMRETERERGE